MTAHAPASSTHYYRLDYRLQTLHCKTTRASLCRTIGLCIAGGIATVWSGVGPWSRDTAEIISSGVNVSRRRQGGRGLTSVATLWPAITWLSRPPTLSRSKLRQKLRISDRGLPGQARPGWRREEERRVVQIKSDHPPTLGSSLPSPLHPPRHALVDFSIHFQLPHHQTQNYCLDCNISLAIPDNFGENMFNIWPADIVY